MPACKRCPINGNYYLILLLSSFSSLLLQQITCPLFFFLSSPWTENCSFHLCILPSPHLPANSPHVPLDPDIRNLAHPFYGTTCLDWGKSCKMPLFLEKITFGKSHQVSSHCVEGVLVIRNCGVEDTESHLLHHPHPSSPSQWNTFLSPCFSGQALPQP